MLGIPQENQRLVKIIQEKLGISSLGMDSLRKSRFGKDSSRTSSFGKVSIRKSRFFQFLSENHALLSISLEYQTFVRIPFKKHRRTHFDEDSSRNPSCGKDSLQKPCLEVVFVRIPYENHIWRPFW